MSEKRPPLIQISPKFVPKGAIDNKSAQVQIVVWHQKGAKPLPEPMMTMQHHFVTMSYLINI